MVKKLFCVFVTACALLFSGSVFAAAIDLNKADQATLEAVKGIGTKVSVRILDERKKGPFKDWNDVMARVKGIKEGAATRLSKEGVTVNGATFEGASATAPKSGKKG